MLIFKCEKYPSLGICIGTTTYKFQGGILRTENEQLIEILKKDRNVVLVDDGKKENKPAVKKVSK